MVLFDCYINYIEEFCTILNLKINIIIVPYLMLDINKLIIILETLSAILLYFIFLKSVFVIFWV